MDILLLAPSFLNLYQDVISELERQGHFVEFIKDRSFEYDPCLIRNKRQSPMKDLWENIKSLLEKEMSNHSNIQNRHITGDKRQVVPSIFKGIYQTEKS